MKKMMLVLGLTMMVGFIFVGCGEKKSQNTGLKPEGVEEIIVEEIIVEEIEVEPINIVTWDNASIESW